ncbi:MAG: hypothetical protein AB1656_13730 [Candidatus Omnitrophota bacterium]
MTDCSSGAIVVDFPESFGKAGLDSQYIKEAVAAIAYYNGAVSEKEACLLINATRRHFEEVILPKFGLSVVGGTLEDASIETKDV